jgi:glyoxylase-like metal-dependent hydrolase (beta-lactamase superfamily II)
MPAHLPDPIIITKRIGDVRLHTFVASFTYDNIADATHIIEGKNTLVLVDGQFLVSYAKQFRKYADDLDKPIDRLYLSHRHPDHWFGVSAAFSDIAVYALPETINFLASSAAEDLRKAHLPIMGDLAPDKVVVPQHVVEPGGGTIDGVKYVFEREVDTEIDFLLTIGLPELGVYIVQDLIYSGTHLYLNGGPPPSSLTREIERWIKVLQKTLRSDYELFLAGHGLPANKNEVARNIEYLSAAKEAIDNGLTKGAFRDFMIGRYPERKCSGIFSIYLPRLFGALNQY